MYLYESIIKRIILEMGLGGKEEEFLLEGRQAVFNNVGNDPSFSDGKMPIEYLVDLWVRKHFRKLLGEVEGESLT